MSSLTSPSDAVAAGPLSTVTVSLSPSRRAWQRFRRNRLGFGSFVIFCTLFVLSLGAELISNDKPLVARYDSAWYFPILKSAPETTFGGDFETPWANAKQLATRDIEAIQEQFAKSGNWALYPPNPYHHSTIDYFAKAPNPAPPSADNWLGTDDRGRDVAARLIYGFRISVLFALALTAVEVLGPSAPAPFIYFQF